MPVIEVKGLDELIAKLRELASGKYMDGVIRASRARLMRRLGEASTASAANRSGTLPGGRVPASGSSIRGRAGQASLLVTPLGPSYARQGLLSRGEGALHRRLGRTRVEAILAEEVPRVEADLVAEVERILK